MFQTNITENIKTRVLRSITFFLLRKLAVYEIMLNIIVESDRPHMTILRMRFASWLPNATNTQSEYGILIALPLQQWFHEHASMLRYTYSACLVLVVKPVEAFTAKQ